ncbi:MAG TPA: STAS domain-containing protein [Alphaproteobacteria bacterium]|nr:STAS domain-containing protein [Alphaproteobacteria bacterium]
MIYKIQNNGASASIELKGRLTFADYSNFREMLQLLSELTIKRCVLDLSDLEFIDSAGLGMLLIARDKVQSQSGILNLKCAEGQVKKMLELGRFDNLFSIEDANA